MVYDAVLLANRYSTFRDNTVVLHPNVEILRNISFHEDVCARLFRNVDNQLPSAEASLIRIKDIECKDIECEDIECSLSHPGSILCLFRLA